LPILPQLFKKKLAVNRKAKKHHFLLFTFAFCLLTSYLACEKDYSAITVKRPPLPPKPEIALSLAGEPYLTEIYLKLEINNVEFPQAFTLTRNGFAILNDTLTTNDTTVIDTGLTPSTSYDYKAYPLVNGQKTDSSSLQAATMDTTSHEFSWEIFTFGNLGNSVLLDLFIVDENDIWAEGEIHISDSTGNDTMFNSIHWDGSQWELKNFIKSGGSAVSRIRGIWVFSQNNIWLAAGSAYHWDGNIAALSYQRDIYTSETVEKLWCISDDDVYGVGNAGLIVHYDGVDWEKQESGTQLGLLDIWGISGTEIYTVGLDHGQVRGVVLQNKGSGWETMMEGFVYGNGFDPSELFKTQLYGTTDGVWVDERGTLYTVGNLMYQYKRGKWNYVTSLPENFIGGNPGSYHHGYLHAIRGNASNDIFIFGESNTIIHFNGSTWKKIGPPYQPFTDYFWFNCAVKGDLIVGVGETGNQARIIRLWR